VALIGSFVVLAIGHGVGVVPVVQPAPLELLYTQGALQGGRKRPRTSVGVFLGRFLEIIPRSILSVLFYSPCRTTAKTE
jgi:hypothetical protein